MKLTWLHNDFIDKNLYAPFWINTDSDYYKDLSKKYKYLIQKAKQCGADVESLRIIKSYSTRVLESICEYYKGNIIASNKKIENLVKGCIKNELAVSYILTSYAFHGVRGSEIQFFRARYSDVAIPYKAKEMLHLPLSMRGKTGNYRFSIPGVPSLYLGNSSYACWLELGRPAEHNFNVSPVVLDGTQRIFNLAVRTRDWSGLNELEEDRVHCWLKLIILMMASSYKIKENNRTFKSEYIISQSIMLACKKMGLDGVAYYSKRVDDEVFAEAAINLALFTNYEENREYSELCNHLKIDDSFNYSLFKNLGNENRNLEYKLRCLKTGAINNISEGSYNRQYFYFATDFCKFDKFLFSTWTNKDSLQWGHALITNDECH